MTAAAEAIAPLAIASAPPLDATLGTAYDYAIVADGASGGALDYTLLAGPDGMTLSDDGAIAWAPARLGSEPVRVRIGDGERATEQSWVVRVAAPGAPLAATLSLSIARVAPGATLALTVTPSGGSGEHTVGARTGGTPVALDDAFVGTFTAPATPGPHDITVTVSDARTSLSLIARFEVDTALLPNVPPSFGGEPPASARVGQPFEERLVVSDPDGDALLFSLLEGPAGMTLDENGTLRWAPESVGTATVRVSATDGMATTERSWAIAVEPGPSCPRS